MKSKLYFKHLISWRCLQKAIFLKNLNLVSVEITFKFYFFYYFQTLQIVLFFRVAVCNVIMKTAAGTSSIILLSTVALKANVNNQTYLDFDHINRPTIMKSLQGVSPQFHCSFLYISYISIIWHPPTIFNLCSQLPIYTRTRFIK